MCASHGAQEKNINPDFDALVFCLQHNLWFNEFHSSVALGNEAMLLLGDCFKFNRAVRVLDLKDGRAGDRGMWALFNGFLANHNLAVTKLYLSGNDIDVRACSCGAVLTRTGEDAGSLW